MNVEILRLLLLPTKVMTVVGTMTMMRLLMMLTMMMMFLTPCTFTFTTGRIHFEASWSFSVCASYHKLQFSTECLR